MYKNTGWREIQSRVVLCGYRYNMFYRSSSERDPRNVGRQNNEMLFESNAAQSVSSTLVLGMRHVIIIGVSHLVQSNENEIR